MVRSVPDGAGSVAGRDRAGGDALAGRVLGDPAGVDDDVQVVLGDRQRREEDRLHLDALRAAVEGGDALDLVHGLAAGELGRDLVGPGVDGGPVPEVPEAAAGEPEQGAQR